MFLAHKLLVCAGMFKMVELFHEKDVRHIRNKIT